MAYMEIEDALTRVKNGALSLKESAYVFKRALNDKIYAAHVNEAIGTSDFDTFLQGNIETRIKMKVASLPKISDSLSFTEQGNNREESLININGIVGTFPEVAEGSEYPLTTYTQSSQKIKTAKYGEMIEITEEMIYFDKTAELNRAIDRLGKKVVRTKDDLILEALVDGTNIANATDGVYTQALGNRAIEALSETAMIERIKAFRLRKDNLGNSLDIAPNILLVTPENEVIARKLLKDMNYTNTSSINVIPDMLEGTQLIVSARLSEIIETYDHTLSKNSWFLARSNEGIIYYEVWPLEIFSQQDDGNSGFIKDAFRYKVRFYGGAGVYNKEMLDGNFVIA